MAITKIASNLSAQRWYLRQKGLPFTGAVVTLDLLNTYLLAKMDLREARRANSSAAKYLRLQGQIDKAFQRIVAVLSAEELAQCEGVVAGLGPAGEEEALPTFEVREPDSKAAPNELQEEVAGDKALAAELKAAKLELARAKKSNALLEGRIAAFIAEADAEARTRDNEIAALRATVAEFQDREAARAALEERVCLCSAAGSHSDHGGDAKAFHYGPCVAPKGMVCVAGILRPMVLR